MNNEIAWELAGLTDTDGHLRPTTLLTRGILIPPAVAVKDGFLQYPLPEDWERRLQDSAQREKALVQLVSRLEDFGWQRREDTKGLVEEFVRLDGATPESFADFAKRWGPLWYADRGVGDSCFTYWQRYTDFPFEAIAAWQELVAEVHTALNVAAYLLQGELVPPAIWASLGLPAAATIAEQRRELRRFLTLKLRPEIGGPRITVWDTGGSFSLRLTTGLGFYWPLWLQVAQLVTQSAGVYVCDGCGRPYVRQGRKPAKGRRNFCPSCGSEQGWLASKRLYRNTRTCVEE